MKTYNYSIYGIFSFFMLFLLGSGLQAQQSITGTFNSSKVNRWYLGEVPNNPQTPMRLVILLPGTTENVYEMAMRGFENYLGNNTMVVYPEPYNRMEGFNGTDTIDDFAMIEELIRDVTANYSIDSNDICIGGFSSGAAFTYELICDFNSPGSTRPFRFKAFAVVAGFMDTANLNPANCPIAGQVPMIAFHGTIDHLANYAGGDTLANGNITAHTDSLVYHWATNINGCNANPAVMSLPDLVVEQFWPSTVEFIEYSGNNGAKTHFYRILGGTHTWPSGDAQIDFFTDRNMDIVASQLIANFFQNASVLSIAEAELDPRQISVYPNPVQDVVSIQTDYKLNSVEVINMAGSTVLTETVDSRNLSLDHLQSGMYLLKINTDAGTHIQRLSKN